jgi:tRNA A37 threonylcarbamoyladenosine modification protein TsaB
MKSHQEEKVTHGELIGKKLTDKDMILQITLDINDIKITLKDGRKIVGELAWTDEYTLSEKLLPNIDALLKNCKVSKHDVQNVTTKITKTSGVTSTRIVQTVAKAWGLGARY